MKKESKRGHSFFFLSGRNHFTEIFGGFVLVPAPHRLLIMIFVFSVFFPGISGIQHLFCCFPPCCDNVFSDVKKHSNKGGPSDRFGGFAGPAKENQR